MRTVTFSDAAIVKTLNESFVSAWANKRPDTKFRDTPNKSQDERRKLPNGLAVSNVTSVFAAADGTVLHAMPGTLDAASFQQNLDFAQKLYDAMFEGHEPRKEARTVYVEAHEKAAAEAKKEIIGRVHVQMSRELIHLSGLSLTRFDYLKFLELMR